MALGNRGKLGSRNQEFTFQKCYFFVCYLRDIQLEYFRMYLRSHGKRYKCVNHLLVDGMKSENKNCSFVSDSLWPPWTSMEFSMARILQNTHILPPGQNTGMGSCSLLQGIFPTQGSDPDLPHYRWILYQLNHKRSPRILEWVDQPFSSGSFWPRNWTQVSCIAGGFFTNWAIRKRPVDSI